VIADSVDGDRFPVVAVNRLRAAGNQANTLTTWVWSGYVPFAWPGKRVFFDPLLFSPAILDRFGEMLLTRAGWRQQLAKNAVVILNRLCYASGNSEWGMANPTKTVAKTRVQNYASGFLRAGAAVVDVEARAPDQQPQGLGRGGIDRDGVPDVVGGP